MRISRKDENVPIWEKAYLTLAEAAEYTGIGVNKLRALSDQEYCNYVLWVGNRRMLNRRKLEEYLDTQKSI